VAQSELPRSILELTAPRWRGRVGFAPSETDFQPLLSAIAKLKGTPTAESWLGRLKSDARVYEDNESVVAQVNEGQIAAGPINSYYWYRLRRERGTAGTHSALHSYAPGDPGDLVDVSGAAVLSSSRKQAAAKKLVAFLVGPTAQNLLAHSDSYEYPLRPGVPPAAGLPPLESFHPAALTPAEIGDGHEALAMERRLGLL
jgi:iron(III) transport system substrate-binding protein